MTRNIAMKLSAAAMLAGLAFAASGTAEASMTSRLQHCKFQSKHKVIECFQQIVKHKKPFWMAQSNSSCQTAAVCTTKKVKISTAITHVAYKTIKVCGINVTLPPDGGGGGGGGETPGGGKTPEPGRRLSITRG